MENIEYFDDKDELINQALKRGEKEFIYTPSPVPWIKLFTFYNWATPFREVLYFYERNEEELLAISFGSTNDGGYIVTKKEFSFDERGDKIEYQDYMYDDPWEIYKNDLEESDIESLGDIIKGIFSSKFEILYNRAMSKLK